MARARLAEVIAALSLAIDTGMGQPLELGLSVARLAVGLGRGLGLPESDLADVYYLALVKHVGCTSDSLEFARLNGGDDIALRARAMYWPAAPPGVLLADMVRHTGAARPALERARLVAGMMTAGRDLPRAINAAHCEAGGRLAARLGLSQGVINGLAHEQERWDGKGLPDGLAGDAVCVAHRVVMVAHDVIGLHHAGAPALEVATNRSGKAYDPSVVAVLPATWERFVVEDGDPWDLALEAEPGLAVLVTESSLDTMCGAIADFVDLKSPYLLGHSTRVAGLVETAAALMNWAEPDRVAARRAALLHDVGRTSVPNGIWDKPGPLTSAEWERVRLHAYFSERVLARSPVLAPLAVAVGGHHEDLDGAGYHRGLAGANVPPAARLLRVADSYDAMTTDRAHRARLSADGAARDLEQGAKAGRLDSDAVAAVLAAARGSRKPLRPRRPSGLTDREIDVLKLLVKGLTNKQIGAELGTSPRTVGHHVAHIYSKAGVSTRAAAALFAMETGIV